MWEKLLQLAKTAAPFAAGLAPSMIDSAMTENANADLEEGEEASEGHPYLAAAAGIGLGALTHRGIKGPFPGLAKSTGTKGAVARSGDPSKATPAASQPVGGEPIVPEYIGNAGIGSPFPKLGYEPMVGSPPPAQPMGAGDDFRRFLSAETRAEPKAPPIMRRKRSLLPYDEAGDIPRQMRENPEIPE